MTEPDELNGDQALLSGQPDELDRVEETEDVLRVRYNGTANQRIMSGRDISGTGDHSRTLVWTPGSEIDYKWFLELAGSEEQARAVLKAHSHEFELVGPGAEDIDIVADEFDVGGVVA